LGWQIEGGRIVMNKECQLKLSSIGIESLLKSCYWGKGTQRSTSVSHFNEQIETISPIAPQELWPRTSLKCDDLPSKC
jgi:hypothetical protein